MAKVTTMNTLKDDLSCRGFNCKYLLESWIDDFTDSLARREEVIGKVDLTHMYLHHSEENRIAYARLNGFVIALEVVGTITRKESDEIRNNLIKNII